MRKKPTPSIVSDHYATTMTSGAVAKSTLRASIVSKIDAALVGVIPKGEQLPFWKDMMQYLPIVGPFFAHSPGGYP